MISGIFFKYNNERNDGKLIVFKIKYSKSLSTSIKREVKKMKRNSKLYSRIEKVFIASTLAITLLLGFEACSNPAANVNGAPAPEQEPEIDNIIFTPQPENSNSCGAYAMSYYLAKTGQIIASDIGKTADDFYEKVKFSNEIAAVYPDFAEYSDPIKIAKVIAKYSDDVKLKMIANPSSDAEQILVELAGGLGVTDDQIEKINSFEAGLGNGEYCIEIIKSSESSLHYVLTYKKSGVLFTRDPFDGKEYKRSEIAKIPGNEEYEFCNGGIFITPKIVNTYFYPLLSLTAEQSNNKTNMVTITIRDTEKPAKYDIYYNTKDDASTAIKYSNAYPSEEYDSNYKETGNYIARKDVSLADSNTYWFWVKAVDSNKNESIFSKSVSCKFAFSALTAPSVISVVQSETSYNDVTVTWRDSKEANMYEIYYNTINDSATATKYNSSGNVYDEYDNDYNLTGFYKGTKKIALKENGTYYFWVKALDGNNNESPFSEVSAPCNFTRTTVNSPIDITVTKNGNNLKSVTITWRDSKNANCYYIYYNTKNDSSTAQKYKYKGYASEEYDENWEETGYYKGSSNISLDTAGTYYIWVKGVDGSGFESEPGDVVSVTIK